MVQQQDRFPIADPFFLAQSDQNTDADSAPQPLSIADTTRLGPYSQFLIDEYQKNGSTVQLNPSTTADSTPAELTALGRSLTDAERAQGFQQVPITREKIAIIVSADNPYRGNLTIQQVAQIFKGQITNWQELGGVDTPIRVIGRPSDHPARLALQNYPLFRSQELDATALFPEEDSTAAVIDLLGVDGISFAPTTEVIERFNLQVIPIDNVSIDDARYPFSQPFTYVYQGDISAEAKKFLDFAQSDAAKPALDFAQRQPQDPARLKQDSPFNQRDTSVTIKSPGPIDASPIAEVPLSSEPENSASDLSGNWLPLALLVIGLGILGWLAYQRVQLEKKQKKVPRPAPNYAERIQAESRSAARNTSESQTSESSQLAESDGQQSGVDSSRLDSSEIHVSDPGDESLTDQVSQTTDTPSFSAPSIPLFDNDDTVLQVATTSLPPTTSTAEDLSNASISSGPEPLDSKPLVSEDSAPETPDETTPIWDDEPDPWDDKDSV